MKRLLLLGGGHAHLFVLEAFIKSKLHGVELILVTPERLAPYSGMMPGVIAGHYRYEQACVDLDPLCRASGCKLRHTRVVRLHPAQRRVECEDGSQLEYDLLSIDTGSTPPAFGIQGVHHYARLIKPIGRFIESWEAFCKTLDSTRRCSITMVGGGAAGFEVILAMRNRLKPGTGGLATPVLNLVSDMPGILPEFPSDVRWRAERALRERGVAILTGTPVLRVEREAVVLGDGGSIASDFTVWATGASAPAWPRDAGLAVDERGFILVDRTLRSLSHEEIFAAGDVASMAGEPRPKAGVWAVRAGPPLANNLRGALLGLPPGTYKPQRRALALLSAGERHAIGNWGPFAWEGRWVWNWKDRIDRAFVGRFSVA